MKFSSVSETKEKKKIDREEYKIDKEYKIERQNKVGFEEREGEAKRGGAGGRQEDIHPVIRFSVLGNSRAI